jgi:type VI secretion system protein ImpE
MTAKRGASMKALELFNAGDLSAAISAAEQAVRSAPADLPARVVLAELLCFAGQFERVDQQLDAALSLDPQHAVGLAQFRRVLRSEVARQDFFDSGRVPELLADPTPSLRARLEGALRLRMGDVAEAQAKFEEAEATRVRVSGTCDGAPFDDWRDADDLLGGVIEVLAGDGQYFWVAPEQIESITFEPPQRPRDLLFRPAQISTRTGPGGAVFVPTLYAGAFRADRDALRLGRETDWHAPAGNIVRGVGQRMWVMGEDGRAILDVTRIEVNANG